MEGCGESLVFRGHASVFPTPGKQLDGHPLLSPPSLWRGLGYTAAPRRNCCLPGLGRLTHVSVAGPHRGRVHFPSVPSIISTMTESDKPAESDKPTKILFRNRTMYSVRVLFSFIKTV